MEDLESNQHRHVSHAVSPSIPRDANSMLTSAVVVRRDVSGRKAHSARPASVLSVADAVS